MKKSILKVLLVAILVFASAVPMMGCYGHDYEEGDFCLTIEIESQILVADRFSWISWIGEEHYFSSSPRVTATLRNLSEQSVRITHYRRFSLFSLYSSTGFLTTLGGDLPPPPWPRYNITLETNGYISQGPFSGWFIFLPGEHEATVTANFYVNYRRRNKQRIQVRSNTISFTVIEQQ
ncbi:MAG: hypothetical protein FWE22_00590 [Firmicutes bacterium]|nr:hypothetical protein [Bacillota bacterium]